MSTKWSRATAEQFLDALSALCSEYGIGMDACSCCEGMRIEIGDGAVVSHVRVSSDPDHEWEAELKESSNSYMGEHITSSHGHRAQ